MTTTLYFTQPNEPNLQQIMVAMQFMGVDLKTQEINKKYDPLILLTPEGTITQPIAILQFLAKEPFAGHTHQEQLKVWEWFEQLNMELHPLLREIYEQVAGRRTPDSDKFDYSLKELMRELDLINHHLKLRTFMVGDSVTLVDISLATHLETALK